MNKKVLAVSLIIFLVFTFTSQAIENNTSKKEISETNLEISQSSFEDSGTIVYNDFEGGFYGILADVGQYYDDHLINRYNPTNLPEEFKEIGKRVTFTAVLRTDLYSIEMWGPPIDIISISNETNPYGNLTISLKTDKENYSLGEDINIYFEIINRGYKNITLWFPNTNTHNLIIENAFKMTVYGYPFYSTGFNPVITTIEVPAKEKVYINHSWNQRGSIFTLIRLLFPYQVLPGQYTIVGFIPLEFNDMIIANKTKINIKIFSIQ